MMGLVDADATQQAALEELRVTEALLAKAATMVDGRSRGARVQPLPDLGLPHNVRRIGGGFFTGALYQWESDAPMIPVDSTVNVCGASVYRLSSGFESLTEFAAAVGRARREIDRSSLVWNYESGNHFISWARATREDSDWLPAGDYLVLHASPAEYKYQFNGLYPHVDNWFNEEIVEVSDPSIDRVLRIITGSVAERFFRWAKLLESVYAERQEFVASLVGRGQSIQLAYEALHYGMPDRNSVAIGCQWELGQDSTTLLMTGPGRPFYALSVDLEAPQITATISGRRHILTPHGLGVRATAGTDWNLAANNLVINGSTIAPTTTLRDTRYVELRDLDMNRVPGRILKNCPGRATVVLHQLCANYRGKALGGSEE